MSAPQGKFTKDEKRQLELEFADMHRSIHASPSTSSNRPANHPRNNGSVSSPINEPAHPPTPQPSIAPGRRHLQYEPYALNDPARRNGFIIVGAIEWDMWVEQNRDNGALHEDLHQVARLDERGEPGDVSFQPSEVQEEEEEGFDVEFDSSTVLAWLAGVPDDIHNHNFVPAAPEALPEFTPTTEEDARDVVQPGMYQSMWADEPPVQHAAVTAANNRTHQPLAASQSLSTAQHGTFHNTLNQGANSTSGAFRPGSGKNVNKSGEPANDERHGVVSPAHFGSRNRRERLRRIPEEDTNDSAHAVGARAHPSPASLRREDDRVATQQSSSTKDHLRPPSSDVGSAVSAETYHSAYHRPNHYTGRSQAPRDLDPPELVASRARGTTEWHEWIMTHSRFPLPRPHVERQIFNCLIPTSADTLLNPPANPAAAQQALDRRHELLGEPCCICFEDIREGAEAPCGHLFCTPCAIRAAIERGEHCPMCRAMMLATALTRIRIAGGEEPEFKHQMRGRLG
ncbi:unnamed protein product [Zymoseptoria tritici ST99CH_1A5]|uniref:RING-type domain-containing protein n=1 Tax=Zymoseptoria tritici ST99CH_1A5 TaxID=1276529 RepID=A0A1Y6LPR0_ZYMTR|nr:unnamed protein product [Zymoseptoria tritici ST99CH_1A5]